MADCWAPIGLIDGGLDGNQPAVAAAVPELSNSPRNRQGTRGFSMGGLFRGVRAPASLKRGVPVLVEQQVDLFRGVRAPASLKRGAAVSPRNLNVPALPGRTRPGLIEASQPSRR